MYVCSKQFRHPAPQTYDTVHGKLHVVLIRLGILWPVVLLTLNTIIESSFRIYPNVLYNQPINSLYAGFCVHCTIAVTVLAQFIALRTTHRDDQEFYF